MPESFFLQNEPVAVNASTLIEKPSDFGTKPEDRVAYWLAQEKVAEKKERAWIKKARKIVARYRDERPANATDAHRYNVLWSNVQTLKPALYARTPKPDIERRFKDQDPVGRTASIVLERCLTNAMDNCRFDMQMRAALDDLLLPGRGVCRVLYIPHFGDEIKEAEGSGDADDMGDTAAVASEGDEAKEPLREVVFEEVALKYVFWEDYREGPARKWQDVPWIRYRAYLTRDELTERFKKGKLVNLDSTAHNEHAQPDKPDQGDQVVSVFKKAEIWEIWDKTQKRVIWIAPGSSELGLLDQVSDPLELPEFFPNPDPLLATTTNDQRIPVPDYMEYQDQASELDLITQRIDRLLRALKVSGVYAGEEKQVLNQLIDAGTENKLIPVPDWASFMTDKGGIQALIQFMPIQQVAETLIQLYDARDRVKQVLYEITGMSDIMRGASSPVETATAQQIKVQFGTMRLSDRQRQIADFARDCIRLMAHVIAKQFSPQTISMMCGYPQVKPVPPPPPGLQQMAPDPQTGQLGPNPVFMQYQQAIQPIIQQNQAATEQFQAACQLLKEDMPHGFRIDIEADSTIMPDEEQEKQARVEFMQAVTPFMQQMLPAAQAMPPFAPVAKEFTLFLIRGFRVARSLEEKVEQFFDMMEKQPPAPPPGQGDPHAAAAQAAGDQAKAQVEAQGQQLQAQTDAQATQADAAVRSQATQADTQTKLQQMQLDAALAQQKTQVEMALAAAKLRQDAQFKSADLALQERDMELRAEAERRRETNAARQSADRLT